MKKTNRHSIFVMVLPAIMVLLSMCSITITAKDHDHDNHHLSCDGPYVIYQPNGGVRVINVTETGVVKDTV